MSKKIVLIGAGSAQFGLGTVADILASQVLKGITICLHDINPVALKTMEQVTRGVIEGRKLPYRLMATTARPEALKGADFCIISIEVGSRFDLWEQDWQIPLEYGSRQIYGENGGPGGLFHALRIIPPVIEICRDIARICPDAYVFNFSNPMSRICLAVKRAFPDLKFTGLCHEIGSMPHHLPKLLKMPFSKLSIKAGGLNHFSVLLDARTRSGQDVYPVIRQKWLKYIQGRPERSLVNSIFRIYGYLPITTDSHFGEYIGWASEIADHKGISAFYRRYKKECFAQIKRMNDIALGKSKEKWWKEPTGERIIPIIEGIIKNSGHYELAVNIPNQGLIDNLPEDLVVEVPATIHKNGVRGVKLGPLPKGIASLLNHEASVQDLTVQAALTKSRHLALEALLADPNGCTFKNASGLLDRMIKLQPKYLGYLE
ncbi:MAG: alpha-glucosidase [Planctomycetota bacterium]